MRFSGILKILFIPLCLFNLTVNSEATPSSYSLDAFIQLAIENNPQIEIAFQQHRQSEGQLVQAKSGYLPRLTVGGDLGRTHIEDLQPEDEDTVLHGLISASQLIYDFGRTTGLIDASIYASVAADSNLLQQIQNVVFQVKENYYSVLERELLIEVAQQSVDTYIQHLYRAKKYFEAGVRTKIDVTNANVELANARLDLLRAKSNLKTARVKLEQVLGIKPNSGSYSLIKEIDGLEQLASKKPEMIESLDYLLQTADDHRPELNVSIPWFNLQKHRLLKQKEITFLLF